MLWVSQNMKEFPEWINTKFIKTYLNDYHFRDC